jgi:hypothetical protein
MSKLGLSSGINGDPKKESWVATSGGEGVRPQNGEEGLLDGFGSAGEAQDYAWQGAGPSAAEDELYKGEGSLSRSLYRCAVAAECELAGAMAFVGGDALEQHQYPYAGACLSVTLLLAIVVGITVCTS